MAAANPDMRIFAGFDDNLRQAFRRETELFLGDIFRQDRSVLDLLSAKYTYLNERLAKHYGIPNVYGAASAAWTWTRIRIAAGCCGREAF